MMKMIMVMRSVANIEAYAIVCHWS